MTMATGSRSNPLALAVLSCLYERPMHPYEIAQTLRHRGKQESIKLNFGSLYAVVESLEKRGLIKAVETVREGRRPERTVYSVTDAGAREHVDWLTSLVAVPVKEYLQFEAALSMLGGLSPEESLAALKERATALQLRIAMARTVLDEMDAAGLPRFFALEVDYKKVLDESEFDFVRRLIKDIETESLEGLATWRGFHELPQEADHGPGPPPPDQRHPGESAPG
ncbi:MAG TPA: PadR family transcriptional regulator [Actinomycetota bacterium]|nr:PadR family transcriptional regulator [Actinomycetota bacterium]